jgi:hypothetical protein
MSEELATYEPTAIVHQQSPLEVNEVLAVVNRVGIILRDVMQEGVHYGKVPGCGPKPCLLKPGAEKLSMTFRLLPRYDVRMDDLGSGHREYSITCTLEGPDGSFRGQGIGSCSTLEKKYRYRTINDQRVENPDIADVYNTVLKMAKKRAHVDAVITATSCGDIFTQDIEDNPEAFARDTRPPLTQPQAKSAPAPSSSKPTISEKQRGRFYAIWKKSGKSEAEVKAYCKSMGFDHSADITTDVYEEMCTWAEAAEREPGQEG